MLMQQQSWILSKKSTFIILFNHLYYCCKQGYVKIQTYNTQSHTDYKVTYSLICLIKINNKACEKQIKTGSDLYLFHNIQLEWHCVA